MASRSFPDQAFESLACGLLKANDLPPYLELGPLNPELADLRERIAADRVEWGACTIVDGTVALFDHHVRGTADGVQPNDEPDDHHVFSGFAHGHLPDPATHEPYMGFSELDYRATLNDGDCLSLLTNGPEAFALVRCRDCTRPRQRVTDSEFDEWVHLLDSALVATRHARNLNNALWQFNRELCQRLGFAFYRGKWNERMRRFEPLALIFRPLPRS